VSEEGNGHIKIPYKNISIIAVAVSLLGGVIGMVSSRVLADNQIKVHTSEISDLKHTDKNFTEYLQLVQKQIIVQETKMEQVQKDIDKISDKMDKNYEKNEQSLREILKAVKA
jgi:septal ring factor EnvC (AmiA/AmiB activator)